MRTAPPTTAPAAPPASAPPLPAAQATPPKPLHFSHDIVEDARPQLADMLRRDAIARSIAAEIRAEDCPRVLGIYGSWGAGKSYLLTLIINTLLAQNSGNNLKVIVCPFQPWRYEHVETGLELGLIKTLRDLGTRDKQFADDPKNRNPEIDTSANKSVRTIASNLLQLMGAVLINSGQTGPAVAGGALRTAAQRLQNNNEDAALAIHNEMQDLVTAILKGAERKQPGKYRLVVFIDDLDRCSPENMVKMFEWLKVHLDARGVTYVLALDHVAAARAIVGQYKTYLAKDEDIAYGFRYLEKLVESEYELEEASQVESMALAEVQEKFARGTHFRTVRDIANNLHGGDFPGIQLVDELVALRSLRIPRTMLKIVGKFDRAMRVIRDSRTETQGRFPASYPFWTLFLICMYFRLDPQSLAEFVDGRSQLYNLLSPDPSREPAKQTEEWTKDPKREFWQFSERLKQFAGAGLQLPSTETLQQLASIIRENVLVPSREDV